MATALTSEVPELVTSLAQNRASLAERKNYRRAMTIDDKLPEASAALANVPRRKAFTQDDEGRMEWKETLHKHAGGELGSSS